MINIYLDNIYARIENAGENIENIIYTELSFTIEEFGSDNVRIRHLFNRKTKKTYAGLVNYIIEILNREEEDYIVIDNRVKHEPNADFKIVDQIEVAPGQFVDLTARPYQDEIIERATERECIQAATGAGKTFMMASLIAKFNVKPVSIFADKLSLCTQIKEEFEKFLGRPIGIVGGGMNQKEDITVYSIQSATAEDVKDSKMIMFDECLAYAEKVLMEDLTYEEIGKLVEEKSTKRVMSYNHQTGELEPKEIISHSKTPLNQNGKKLMRIKIRKEDGALEIIECTDNHKIWVESLGQYVEAKDLVKGQSVLTIKN
jgi:hypothetical protein